MEAPPDAPLLWPLLIVLLVILLLALRYVGTLPENRAKRHKEQAESIFYQAMESVLSLMQLKRHPAQTLHGFAEKVAERGLADAADTITAYAESLYGNRHDAEKLLCSQYRALYHRLPLAKKMLFRLKSMAGRS